MKLNFKYIDNGKPLLVMIHGLLSSLDTFLPLVPLLESQNSLLLVDLKGHGETPPEGLEYTAHAMAKDVNELVQSLGIKKFSVLGHSMGGRVALAYAELFPEQLEKLIIEDMGIHQRQVRTSARDEEKNTLAKSVEVTSLNFNSKDEIYPLISPLFSYAKNLLHTKVTEMDGKFKLKFWPHVSVLFGYQGNYSDLTNALIETDIPVMFINADPEQGSALAESCIEHIKKNVPRAKIVVIPNAGHSVHKTHPKEFVATVQYYLHES